MTKLYMPDGREVDQGGPEDRATWWSCRQCGFNGPYVGTDKGGEYRCMGIICGGITENPNVPCMRSADMPNVKFFGTPITVDQAKTELAKREKN